MSIHGHVHVIAGDAMMVVMLYNGRPMLHHCFSHMMLLLQAQYVLSKLTCANFTDLAWLLVRVNADHVQGTLKHSTRP